MTMPEDKEHDFYVDNRGSIHHIDDSTFKLIDTSDTALALEFADRHSEVLRYTKEKRQWYLWIGTAWREDRVDEAGTRCWLTLRTIAKRVASKMAHSYTISLSNNGDSPQLKRAKEVEAKRKALNRTKTIKSAPTCDATIRLATREPRFKMETDGWDGDASLWLFNTHTGTLKLEDCIMKTHDPQDYITKMAAVAPQRMSTPMWDRFLKWATCFDGELEAYLQRVAGYCLTGSTKEQVFFFAFGGGGNGKSTFVGTLASIMGDYHCTADINTFISKDKELHSTYTAVLQGARLVTAHETKSGRYWDEARLKQMTGGDRIRAHYMRQDSFEYTPRFKLLMHGNYLPSLRAVDAGIARRMQIIPFKADMTEATRVKDYEQLLKPEWPGILQWMIDGCLEWQRLGGLKAPAAVTEATSIYLQREDRKDTWIKDCCSFDPNAFSTVSDLFRSWETWALSEGERVGSKKEFSMDLERRAPYLRISYRRTAAARGFSGIEVTS